MFRWMIILVALAGLAMGIYTVMTSTQDLPKPPPAEPPSVNPYPTGIAATGIVEAATRNVAVAAPEPGLVTDVFAQVGDHVKKGQPLYQLDRRMLEAELTTAKASLATAEAELTRLKAAPRAEDIPPMVAAVEQAKANYDQAKIEYNRIYDSYTASAANRNEVDKAKYTMDAAKAAMDATAADLARTKAGTWKQDLLVAQKRIDEADANIKAINERLDRLTIRSPIDGQVIKRNIEPGEYTSPATAATSGMSTTGASGDFVVGDLSHLHIRAQIDEEDAVLLRPGDPAQARPRGPRDVMVPLKMIRIEPLAIPKRQITGVPTELIDTRVIEVVYDVTDLGKVPLYPGQLVDVFVNVETGK